MSREKVEADVYWYKLNKVKEITGNVTMTPEQFRKQLEQAVKFGHKCGYEHGLKQNFENNKPSDPFSKLFGL